MSFDIRVKNPVIDKSNLINKERYIMSKILVAYFSAQGRTAKFAKVISEITGSDLFEIKPEVPYSSADLNWNNPKSRSSIEMEDKTSRPAISTKINNFSEYDTIFVGFPIWWYIAPTIINTFLEQYDFSGKTVIPFCTSGGSGVGETDKYLHPSCSDKTNWKPAHRLIRGDKNEISAWINSLNL